MTTKLRIPAKMLRDGDVITSSSRYGYRVRGSVKVRSVTPEIVFLEEPTLPNEDVAFRAVEWVDVNREET